MMKSTGNESLYGFSVSLYRGRFRIAVNGQEHFLTGNTLVLLSSG